jgi:SAM-dependent methyltransferase
MSVALEIQRRLEENARNYNGWVFRQVEPALGRRVVDVGAGTANVTQFLGQRELVVVLDVCEELLAAARARLAGRRNHVFARADIEDPAVVPLLREYRIDSAMCVNTLEHVERDDRALRHLWEALPPSGEIGLLVPAIPGIYGTMDRADAHFRRYSRRSLARTVEEAGFGIARLRFANLPGILGWVLNGKVLRRQMVDPSQYRFYDRLVPLIASIEGLAPPPIGLSLVCWARKRG